jgi:PPOX class probable F420-dependent enzyme
MTIKVAQFLDVADGLQQNQFAVGSHGEVNSLNDLNPIYRQLLDNPSHCIIGLVGGDGGVNMTPIWFDYEDDTVLVNIASQRKKCEWIRANGRVSLLLMNPDNPYHWMSIKATLEREISEDDPAEGQRVTDQLNKIWVKYIGDGDTYQLRDPSINERRNLFVCKVTRVALFGKP